MFDIKDVKTFKDSVHGYINIPRCFVENIIDTEYFQRLRNIDQTGMKILYPNAKHDRFSHSLGVFYLGQKAVDALLENFLNDPYWNISSDNNKHIFWAKNKVLFLIACLLHDIGHTPFSHSLEDDVIENLSNTDETDAHGSNKLNFTKILANLITDNESINDGLSYGDIQASSHEQLGARLILEKFNKNIELIYDYLIEINFPNVNDNGILYAEHYNNKAILDKKSIKDDICFIARMILGLKYNSYLPERQIRNCFIELLNGDNFDVDKLDYIVRDTQMSGISNVAIDVERLLKSLCIVTKTLYWDKIFDKKMINNVTLHCIDNYKYVESNKAGEINISAEQFIGIIIIYEGAEVCIKSGSTFVSLLGDGLGENANIQYKKANQYTLFSDETYIIKNGTEIEPAGYKTLSVNNVTDLISCRIKNATIINSSPDFLFKVVGKQIQLTIHGKCNITISGKYLSLGNIRLSKESVITGKVNKIEILGDAFKFNTTKHVIPTKYAYNTFSIGFRKQAINLIANVLDARNYLYLWIYAHHKVIYYANFLIPSVTNAIFRNITDQKFPCWKLNYENLKYLDDSYIWTTIKYIQSENNGEKLIKELCNELISRNYKHSLYKSLAEYDMLFETFSFNQKLTIHNYLSKQINDKKPFVKHSDVYLGGYVDSFLKKLKATQPLLNCVNQLIFVDANYKYKRLNLAELFLVFSDAISSMDKIPLLKNMIQTESINTEQYFYLYYDYDHTKAKQINVPKLLKEEIYNFFHQMFNDADKLNPKV